MNGVPARVCVSERLTVLAWILTSTSSSAGTGRSTSSIRRMSGGPYLSQMIARMRGLPMDRSAVIPGPPRAVELRRPATRPTRPGAAARRNDPTFLGHDSAPEVRSVELDAPYGLVDRAKLGQSERRPNERRRDARELEFAANAVDRVTHDLQVVERQVDLALQDIRNGNQCTDSRF